MAIDGTAPPIIHTTVAELADELAPFAGTRRVEVRVLDATDEERRAAILRAIEAADDDPVSIDEDTVFAALHAVVSGKRLANELQNPPHLSQQ